MKAEDLKRIIKEELVAILAENAPAKERETTTAPPKTTPSTTPKRRGFDQPAPGVNPKPKAGLKEDEMIDKIVARFKSSKKSLDELGFSYPGKPEPRAASTSEYEKGYEEGFKAALEAMAAKLGVDLSQF
jgi:hypothetical protein